LGPNTTQVSVSKLIPGQVRIWDNGSTRFDGDIILLLNRVDDGIWGPEWNFLHRGMINEMTEEFLLEWTAAIS
jgi:hypothetical protein